MNLPRPNQPRTVRLIHAACAILAVLALAPSAKANELIDIYRLAQTNDQTFRAAQHALAAGREALPQARAALLPGLAATGNVAYNHNRTTSNSAISLPGSSLNTDDSDSFDSYGYGLTLSLPVFRRDLSIGVDQAKSQVSISELQFIGASQNLTQRVIQRYLAALAAQDDLRFSVAEREAIGQELAQAKARYEVGDTAITGLREAQARYDSANAQVIADQSALESAREALTEITGQRFETLTGLQKDIPLNPPIPNAPTQWVDFALQQNPELLAATLTAKIAREDIQRRAAGAYPTLDLNMSHNDDDTSDSRTGADRNDNRIALQLNFPFYQGGAVRSQVREGRELLGQREADALAQQRSVTRSTRDAFQQVLSGISRVKALQQAVASNRTALEATQAGYEVGTRTEVDVLDARRDLFSAQRDFTQSRYNYLLSLTELKRATGHLYEPDLTAIDQLIAGQSPAKSDSP